MVLTKEMASDAITTYCHSIMKWTVDYLEVFDYLIQKGGTFTCGKNKFKLYASECLYRHTLEFQKVDEQLLQEFQKREVFLARPLVSSSYLFFPFIRTVIVW